MAVARNACSGNPRCGCETYLLSILRQPHLISILDLLEFLPELLVVHEALDLVQKVQVFEEIVATQFVRDQSR